MVMSETNKRITAQNIMARYDLSDNDKLFMIFQLYKDDLKEDYSQLYYALLGWSDSLKLRTDVKLEPGCDERNVWGKKETGQLLCKNCSATYESKAICQAVERKYFLVKESDE
jgi:hypothetical protein